MNRQGQISKQGVIVGFITGLILSFAFQFMNGCTTINAHSKPPLDWPNLEVKIERVGFWKTGEMCQGTAFSQLLVQTFGCAWINFDTMTCTIYLSHDDPHLLEHELMHCEGYDHIGVSTLANGWEEWKKNNPEKYLKHRASVDTLKRSPNGEVK